MLEQLAAASRDATDEERESVDRYIRSISKDTGVSFYDEEPGWDLIGPDSKNIKKKILPNYFKAVLSGLKTFELRKDEDDIQPGDILDLLEWDGEKYTGQNVRCIVTYVLRNCPEFGLMEGFCIIGIETIGEVMQGSRKFRD